jgi:hypothetical protein
MRLVGHALFSSGLVCLILALFDGSSLTRPSVIAIRSIGFGCLFVLVDVLVTQFKTKAGWRSALRGEHEIVLSHPTGPARTREECREALREVLSVPVTEDPVTSDLVAATGGSARSWWAYLLTVRPWRGYLFTVRVVPDGAGSWVIARGRGRSPWLDFQWGECRHLLESIADMLAYAGAAVRRDESIRPEVARPIPPGPSTAGGA